MSQSWEVKYFSLMQEAIYAGWILSKHLWRELPRRRWRISTYWITSCLLKYKSTKFNNNVYCQSKFHHQDWFILFIFVFGNREVLQNFWITLNKTLKLIFVKIYSVSSNLERDLEKCFVNQASIFPRRVAENSDYHPCKHVLDSSSECLNINIKLLCIQTCRNVSYTNVMTCIQYNYIWKEKFTSIKQANLCIYVLLTIAINFG